MNKVRITATSYLNTIPFVYGIRNSGYLKDYVLDLEVPSGCAKNLIAGKADIGLIPVGALPEIGNEFEIIYNYCLGANGKVKTVVLLSRVPLNKMKNIYLDFESRTSVRLVKVLAEKFWKLNEVKWHDIRELRIENGEWRMKNRELRNENIIEQYKNYESVIAIGDKTFGLFNKYEYIYDLAEEWYKFTSLPFVFACWLKRKTIGKEIIEPFTQAIKFGIDNKLKAVREYKETHNIEIDLEEYVEKYMSYEFNEKKQEALKLFISLLVH